LNVGLGNALGRRRRRDEPGAQTVCSKVAFDAGGERQALHEPRDVDRCDAVRGQLLAAVERTEHRAVDDRSGFKPCADVGCGAKATVGNERDTDLATLAFLVPTRSSTSSEIRPASIVGVPAVAPPAAYPAPAVHSSKAERVDPRPDDYAAVCPIEVRRGEDFDKSRERLSTALNEPIQMFATTGDHPKVFISYSHDSREHADRVLTLCNRLRDDGFDAVIDQFVVGFPPEGWPRWQNRMFGQADFVLAICTETYSRRFELEEVAETGRGVKSEGLLMANQIFWDDAFNTKTVPVVFSHAHLRFIPNILRGGYYELDADDGYQHLSRHLRRLPSALMGPIGALPSLASLPTIERHHEFFGAAVDRNRRVLLSKVRNHWLRGVLEKSLQQRPLIAARLRERFDCVGLGRDIDSQATSPLPEDTRVVDVFDRLGALRTLLMLGAPGSGKTIELLTLARELCDRAEQDRSQPMPVVFNLSSWKPGPATKTLTEWLVRRLLVEYHVTKEQGVAWIADEQLLLLLDGLDEVAAPSRGSCVDAINAFLRDHGKTEMVVCARSDAYRNLPTHLNLESAIEVEPLSDEQVSQYLEHLASLKSLVDNDLAFRELAKMPLMLNVLSFAYEGAGPVDLGHSTSLEDRRRRVFDTYIERMLKRRDARARYPPAVVIRSLVWLAQMLSARSQSLFLLDHLQPEVLPTSWQRRLYRIVAATVAALVTCCSVVLPLGILGALPPDPNLRYGLVSGLLNSAFIVVPVALIVGLAAKIEPVETLAFSSARLKSTFGHGVIGGMRIGAICGAVFVAVPVIGSVGALVFHGNIIAALPIIAAASIAAVTTWRPRLILASMIALAAMFSGITGFQLVLHPHAWLGWVETNAIVELSGVLSGGLVIGVFALVVKPRRVRNAVNHVRSLLATPRSNLVARVIRGVLIVLGVGFVGMIVATPVKLLLEPPFRPAVWPAAFFLSVIDAYITITRLLAQVSLVLAGFGAIIGGIWRVCTQGFMGPDLDVRVFPNQGIQRTAIYAGIMALVGASVFGVLLTATLGSLVELPWPGRNDFLQSLQPAVNFIRALTHAGALKPEGALLGFLVVGFSGAVLGAALIGVSAGRAVIQHYALRAVLWLSRRIPWHLVRLLDDATDFAFLQRVGGSYMFIHRSLQEHFAAIEAGTPRANVNNATVH
jgi:hypothetical protein